MHAAIGSSFPRDLLQNGAGHDTVGAMRTLRTISLALLAPGLALGFAALAGCGHTHALVPVDSPLLTWSPPEDLQPSPAETAPAPAPAAKPAAESHGGTGK